MAELMQNDKVLEAIATQFDPQRQCQGIADFPYSLMEGLAGTICYHCDLLHPQTAAFPGYDGEVCFVWPIIIVQYNCELLVYIDDYSLCFEEFFFADNTVV